MASIKSTCASEAQINSVTSLNFRIAFLLGICTVLGTFVLSAFAVKLIHKMSTFQSSTKIILFFHLFYANAHQLLYAFVSIDLILKPFLLNDPCEWLPTDKECVPYTSTMYFGICGMIYSQTGALIERAFATFHPNYNTNLSRAVGVIISSLVFLLSIFYYRIILWDDPLDGVVYNCFHPASNSLSRASIALSVACLFTFFNLFSSMALIRYNKRLEYNSNVRFKVQERFKKREAIDSTHTICIISMSQFVTMSIYSIGLLILKYNSSVLDASVFLGLIVWIYTIPYSALLFPLILVYRIRATKASRTRKILAITSKKQTQMEHINQITSMWE